MADYSEDLKKVQLNLRVPKYLKDFLRRWAEESNTDMTSILMRYVREELERREIRKESGDVESI